MTNSILIFGATGGVANYTLHYLISKGAHVALAMRDPSKPVPGLTPEQEEKSCTRIKADLTDSASVSAAVNQSGAKSAFIYLIHGPQGTPRASIQALKDSGVERVVFLSSITVHEPIRDIKPDDFIPFIHAQVEIHLEDVYGEGHFTALRPGYFASNLLRYAPQIKSGVVQEYYPTNNYDYIAPKDIGESAAALLLKEDPSPRVVKLTGPQIRPLEDVLKAIAKENGKTLKVEHIERQQAIDDMTKSAHLPLPIASYLAKASKEIHDGTNKDYSIENFKVTANTVPELLGRSGISVEEWVAENKAVFS